MNNFDINQLNNNPSILLIGPRRCGKTILIKNILTHFNFIKPVIVFNRDKYNGSSLYSYDKNFITNVDIEEPNIMESLASYVYENPDNKKCLIFEDSCIFVSKKIKDPEFIQLLSDTKDYNTTIIITTQYPYNPSEIQNMIDYYFLFYWDFESNNIRLFNIFKTKFTSLEYFKTLFKNFTGNEWHHPMILDNHTNEIFGYQTPDTEWFGWNV